MTTQEENVTSEVPPTDRRLSRRGFLRALGVSAGAAVLAACGVTTAQPGAGAPTAEAGGGAAGAAATSAPAAGGNAKITLEFWNFSEARVGFVKEVLNSSAWTSAHPDVAVNFRNFPYDQMHDKLLAALSSGVGAPDIADVEISRFSRFIKGERVGFVPLNDRIGSEKDNLFTGAAIDPWSWKGQIYGLGNELNTVVMAYRKDVLDGLGVKTPFETWDDVKAAGEKVVGAGKSKMFAIHDISWGDQYMMAQHSGTTFFDEQGNYQGDNDKSVGAMQFLHDLVYKDKIAGIAPATATDKWSPPPYFAAFKAEQFVATWGPPWHLGNLLQQVPDQKGKWTVQALPKGLGDSKPTANFGGTGQCITEQSKNPDIAWELIKMSNLTKEGVLADFKLRTAYPSYKPAYEDQALKAPSDYFGGVVIGDLYTKIAPDLPPFRQSPFWPEATDAMERIVITPVMQDKTDAKTALTALKDEVERLKKQG